MVHPSIEPIAPRPKLARAHSPGPTPSGNEQQEARPTPPKRARKAINCEPCRNSKLKCDRNRPCSSCVLRGTTGSCYQDADSASRTDERSKIDAAAEFARIRQSLSNLEAHVLQNPSLRISHNLPSVSPSLDPSTSRNGNTSRHTLPDTESDASSEKAKSGAAPGMLGQQDSAGFYTGPTSTLSHLIQEGERHEDNSTLTDSSSNAEFRSLSFPNVVSPVDTSTRNYDEDLVNLLPAIHTIDGLVDYYFEYCNWIYRHVNQTAFLRNWAIFKSGNGGDRVVLATVCILILLAVRYLPNGHPLLSALPASSEELSSRYCGIMREALQRRHNDMRKDGLGKGYTLDYIELLLVRSHYLTFAKEDPEEIWSVKGQLVTVGTAMGLHRDPGDRRFGREEVERRRWAWWHIILLERWQAFMFGRPITIATHHFNTKLPSYCDPSLDNSGRLYLPNIALFKLACTLGYIMDDAVSFDPVPYSSVQKNDARLVQWMEELPVELDLDEYRVARSLQSHSTSVRRLGVQSVIIRTAYHHIRFTLHRPYASIPASLETAVASAGHLITLVGQTRSDFLSNSALAVPGHMNWGPFHVFSAAMFFSFQLITHPEQPCAALFRENIKKGIACLEQSRWMPVADQALTILQALAPLYSDKFAQESAEERKRQKGQVLKLVRTLAFPYQDSANRGDSASSSPAVGVPQGTYPDATAGSPSGAVYNNNPNRFVPPQKPHTRTQLPVSSMRWEHDRGLAMKQEQLMQSHLAVPDIPTHSAVHTYSHHPQQQQQQQPQPQPQQHMLPSPNTSFISSYPDMPYNLGNQMQSVMDNGMLRDLNAVYTQQTDDGSAWGASVGFGLGEWASFLDVMQRPDGGTGGMGNVE